MLATTIRTGMQATICSRFRMKKALAIVAGLRAPAEKHDAAVGLMHIGFWLLGLGVAVAACYWLYRRLAD
jgi:hypothetical protein